MYYLNMSVLFKEFGYICEIFKVVVNDVFIINVVDL